MVITCSVMARFKVFVIFFEQRHPRRLRVDYSWRFSVIGGAVGGNFIKVSAR